MQVWNVLKTVKIYKMVKTCLVNQKNRNSKQEL